MIQLVKGTKDIYGAEVKAWQRIEGKMRNLCETSALEKSEHLPLNLQNFLSEV